MHQPLTALQISRRTGLSFDTCRDLIPRLASRGIVRCLNGNARRSRLYWLTQRGKTVQAQLTGLTPSNTPDSAIGSTDWELYGSVCFSHRSEIIKTLTEPLQPSEIKRRARSRNPDLRMSANNVRNVIRLFLAQGIVRPVRVRKKAHLRYELTELGRTFQALLRSAERFS